VSVGADRTISSDSFFGCSDRSVCQKLVEYAVDKDNQAFKQALGAELLTGGCRMFQRGESVFIADTAIFSGLVKVRRRGETEEYWTAMEAVK